VVDVLLYRFSKKYVAEKTNLFKDQKHKDEVLEHHKKINKLIFTNGLLYFFSHMPEFVVTIITISFDKKLKLFSAYYFTSSKLIELSEVFSLLAISLQFFVLNHFDSNFKASFKQIKENLRRKIIKN
jgi:hypothetical protein